MFKLSGMKVFNLKRVGERETGIWKMNEEEVS